MSGAGDNGGVLRRNAQLVHSAQQLKTIEILDHVQRITGHPSEGVNLLVSALASFMGTCVPQAGRKRALDLIDERLRELLLNQVKVDKPLIIGAG